MGRWASKHKGKVGRYLLLGGIGLYFYSALVNSIRLGIERTFGPGPVERVFEWSPFKNLAALFTPTGFGITFFSAVMYLLFTRKGFNWLTGIQINRDPRGFDTLSDGTHGTSGWMARKEFGKVFEIGDAASVKGTLLGKHNTGLTGTTIHPYARLVAVADVFDALASKRAYKQPWSVNDACAYLEENTGTLFDGRYVQALLNILNQVLCLYGK